MKAQYPTVQPKSPGESHRTNLCNGQSHFARCQTLGREHDTSLTDQNTPYLSYTVMGAPEVGKDG